MKYILAKEYPHSPSKGTIVTQAPDGCYYDEDSVRYSKAQIENYPHLWKIHHNISLSIGPGQYYLDGNFRNFPIFQIVKTVVTTGGCPTVLINLLSSKGEIISSHNVPIVKFEQSAKNYISFNTFTAAKIGRVNSYEGLSLLDIKKTMNIDLCSLGKLRRIINSKLENYG